MTSPSSLAGPRGFAPSRSAVSGWARTLGVVLDLRAPLDIQAVLRTVGSAACARGLKYFEAGAVRSLSVGASDGEPILIGTVQGTAPRPYSVTVYPPDVSWGIMGGHMSRIVGECSCPVGVNCKHVAALMFAVGRMPPAGGRSADGAAPLADWELALNLRGFARQQASQDLPRVALLIEPRRRETGLLALSMRPMLLGDRGRWVRSGISWRDTTYPYHAFPEAPVDLLREILALNGGGSRYGGDPTTIDLMSLPSARIWPLLGEASAASLALISTAQGDAVELLPQPVRAGLAVEADGENWLLRPEVTLGGVPIDAAVALIGNPAHGVAWTSTAGAGSFDADDESARGEAILHLARLAQPLEAGPRRLIASNDVVTVPAADQRRFVREYLPVVRTQLHVVSRGGSVDLPTAAPGRLVLVARRDGDRRVRVTWHWRYSWADETIDIPLGEPDRPELRDAAAEKALLAATLGAVRQVEPLRRRGMFGPELVPNVVLTALDAVRFARNVVPLLAEIDGIELDIADDALDFREAAGAPVITVSGSVTTHTDWLDLKISVTVDGQQVPFAELFRALATGQDILVLPTGSYFLVDRPELQQLRALIEESWSLEERDTDSLRTSKYHASLWAELDAMGVLDEQARAWSASVRELAHVTEIPTPPPPEGFTATLRPYQQAGYTWLSFLADHRLGGVLADDMGLGKTVQALAMITRARADKPDAAPFLVVAPTSVVSNWAEEAGRFAPGLKVVTISATAARRGQPLSDVCEGADIVISSYALFRLEYEEYEAISWTGLLLDEAQNIKNHLAKGYKLARSLPAGFKVAITGTPMENNLMELWAMFSIVAPGLLGTPIEFAERYRNPVEREQSTERLAQLRRRIRPLLMRRTKGEVVRDLPPKTEQNVELELSSRHRRAYQRLLHRERRKVLGLIGDMDRNRFQIFRSLTLLRQAALDISLVDPVDDNPPSSKLDALMELVANAAGEGHRMLVFSQFTRFLGRVRERLDAAGIGYTYLDGRTRQRAAVLAEFRDGNAPVFLISLKAGGVGLNLTEADYCVLTDPWWNPATEQQAIDRTHRIGQTKPVMVYRLVAKDTIEDKVLTLSARKAALVSSVMDDGGIGTSGLSAADIRGLLS